MTRRSITFALAVTAIGVSTATIAISTPQRIPEPSQARGRNQATPSQPPAPTPREGKSDPPQRQSEPAQRDTSVSQIGTEETPAVVRVLPTTKSQREATQEQEDRENEASTKRWTIGLTGLMVLVGL